MGQIAERDNFGARREARDEKRKAFSFVATRIRNDDFPRGLWRWRISTTTHRRNDGFHARHGATGYHRAALRNGQQ
jgi:hypothetical protein